MEYLGVFLCALVLDLGWVLSVRAVEGRRTAALVLSAMLMQFLSYESTVIVVHNTLSIWAGTLGAGVGAGLGLLIPDRWIRPSMSADDDGQ